VTLTRQLTAKGGVITFDVPIQKTGLVPASFIEQLQAIGKGMK
jgi:hypothetical protein